MKKIQLIILVFFISGNIYSQCPAKLKRGIYVLQSDLSKCSPDKQRSLGAVIKDAISISFGRTVNGVCSAGQNNNLVRVSRYLSNDRVISKYFEYDGNNRCDFLYKNIATNESQVINISQIMQGNL